MNIESKVSSDVKYLKAGQGGDGKYGEDSKSGAVVFELNFEPDVY